MGERAHFVIHRAVHAVFDDQRCGRVGHVGVEYTAWQETAHLFRSPANARGLLDAYERARAHMTEVHDRSGRSGGAHGR